MSAADNMSAAGIARRLAELGQTAEAQKAYTLAIQEARAAKDSALELEAALYILQSGGNYKVAYDSFVSLYNGGAFQDEVLRIMREAFYAPNQKLLRSRYEKNCKLLKKYKYCFREDFPAFSELPVEFFPYDDNSYLPFYPGERRFGELIDFDYPVVSRNFFKDLSQPVLAEDVFSLYELRYLNDTVRKSEYVGRENHIYLHYTDWAVFCAHLPCWNLRQLLAEKKFVFLIESEIAQYPLDFKARFGEDYSQYPVKPWGIREINRMIWHTQLSSHNGGDFFNEVFDSHPNLICMPSVFLYLVEDVVRQIRGILKKGQRVDAIKTWNGGQLLALQDPSRTQRVLDELASLKNPTDKDCMVALFLGTADLSSMDEASRIAPAIFFQPHFENIVYGIRANEKGWAVLESEAYDAVRESSLFREFPYIKTFTPLRRFTTSYAATVRFMYTEIQRQIKENPKEAHEVSDVATERVLNRSFMADPQDRLFQDSVIVRFEDGKLNPKATFTALAAFLDLPYTESMTYCSEFGKRDPHPETKGFDPAPVYKTYDQFAGHDDRYYLEYFLRDAYQFYGYDFQYYDGAPMDLERAKALFQGFTILDNYIRETTLNVAMLRLTIRDEAGNPLSDEALEEGRRQYAEEKLQNFMKNRLDITKILLGGLKFINRQGQPLRMIPRLELDPALLEQPLYH